MSTRIEKRKHGRETQSGQASGATHKISIGFDARKQGAGRPFPGKLPGFLINRDALGADGKPMVDWEAMGHLGPFTEANLAQAKKTQLKSEPDLLPTVLDFVIVGDAQRVRSGWEYPGTYSEAYVCYGPKGRFCHGNGERAERAQGDGTIKVIDCVPFGKTGVEDAKQFCAF